MKKVVQKKTVEPPSRLTENIGNALKEIAGNTAALAADLKAVRLVKAIQLDSVP
jgi:small subunit ribosomal protein S7e